MDGAFAHIRFRDFWMAGLVIGQAIETGVLASAVCSGTEGAGRDEASWTSDDQNRSN